MSNSSGPNTSRRSARSRNVSESSESSCFGSDTRSVVSTSAAVTRRLRCPADSESNSPLDNNSPSRVNRKKRRKNEDDFNSIEERRTIIRRHIHLSRRKKLDEELIRLKLKDSRIPHVLLTRLEDERSQPQPKPAVEVEEEKAKEKAVERVKLPGLSIPAEVDLTILKRRPIIKINKQQTENLLQVRKKQLLRETERLKANHEDGLVDASDGSGITSESDKCAERLTEKLENRLSDDSKCTKNTIVSNSDKRLARIYISKDMNDRLPERLLKSDSSCAERSDGESQSQSSKIFVHSNRRLTRNSIDQSSDKHSAVLVNNKPKDTESTVSSGKDSDDSNKNVKKYSKHTSNDNLKHSQQVIDKCNKKNSEVSSDGTEQSMQSSVKERSENQSVTLSKTVSGNLETSSRLRKRLASKNNEKRPDDSVKSSSCESAEPCSTKESEKLDNTIQNALETLVKTSDEQIGKKPSRRLDNKMEYFKTETENHKRTAKKIVDKNEGHVDDLTQNCINIVENIEKCETLPELNKNVEKHVNNQIEKRRSTRNVGDKTEKLIPENNSNCIEFDAEESSKSQSQTVDKNIQKCSTNLNENSKRLTRNHIFSVQNISENDFKKFDEKLKIICTKSIVHLDQEKSGNFSKALEEKLKKVSDKSMEGSVKVASENVSKNFNDKVHQILKIPVENDKGLKKNSVNKKQKHVDNIVVSNVGFKQNFVKESKKDTDVHHESKKVDTNVVEINQRLKRKSTKSNEVLSNSLTKTILTSEEIPNEINEKLSETLNTNCSSTQTDVNKRKLRRLSEKKGEVIINETSDNERPVENSNESLHLNTEESIEKQSEIAKRSKRKSRGDSENEIKSYAHVAEQKEPSVQLPQNVEDSTKIQNDIKKITRNSLQYKSEKQSKHLEDNQSSHIKDDGNKGEEKNLVEPLVNIKDSTKQTESKIVTRNSSLEKHQRCAETTGENKTDSLNNDKIEKKISDQTSKSISECHKDQTETNKRPSRKLLPIKNSKSTENLKKDLHYIHSSVNKNEEKSQKIVKECSKSQSENHKRVTRKSSPDKHERLVENKVSNNTDFSVDVAPVNDIELSEFQKSVENKRITRRLSTDKSIPVVKHSAENSDQAHDVSQMTIKGTSKIHNENSKRITRKISSNKCEKQVETLTVNNLESSQNIVDKEENKIISEKLDNKENSKTQIELNLRITRNSSLKKEKHSKNLVANNADFAQTNEEIPDKPAENLVNNGKIFSKNPSENKKVRKNSIDTVEDSKSSEDPLEINVKNQIVSFNQNSMMFPIEDMNDSAQPADLNEIKNLNTYTSWNEMHSEENKECFSDLIVTGKKITRKSFENEKQVETSDVNAESCKKHLPINDVNATHRCTELIEFIETFTDADIDDSTNGEIYPENLVENPLENNINSCNERSFDEYLLKENNVQKDDVNQTEENDPKENNIIFCEQENTSSCAENVIPEGNAKDTVITDKVFGVSNETLILSNTVAQELIKETIAIHSENLDHTIKESDRKSITKDQITICESINKSSEISSDSLVDSSNAMSSEELFAEALNNHLALQNLMVNPESICSKQLIDGSATFSSDLIEKNEGTISLEKSFDNKNLVKDSAYSSPDMILQNSSDIIEDSHAFIDKNLENAIVESFINNDETCTSNSLAEDSNNVLFDNLLVDQETFAKQRRKVTLMELKKKCTENIDKKQTNQAVESLEKFYLPNPVENEITALFPESTIILNTSMNATLLDPSSDSCTENVTESEETCLESFSDDDENLADRFANLKKRETLSLPSTTPMDPNLTAKQNRIQNRMLNRHRVGPHLELKPNFHCRYCNDTFVSNRELKKHVKVQHRQRLVMKITKTDSNEHVTHMVESMFDSEGNAIGNNEGGSKTPRSMFAIDKTNEEAAMTDPMAEGDIKIIVRKESGSKNSHVVKEIKITPRASPSTSDHSGGNSIRMPGMSPALSDLSGGNSARFTVSSPIKFDGFPHKRRPGRPRKYPIFTETELLAKKFSVADVRKAAPIHTRIPVVNNGAVRKEIFNESLFTFSELDNQQNIVAEKKSEKNIIGPTVQRIIDLPIGVATVDQPVKRKRGRPPKRKRTPSPPNVIEPVPTLVFAIESPVAAPVVQEEKKQKVMEEEKKQKVMEEEKKQKVMEEEKQKVMEEEKKQKVMEEETNQKIMEEEAAEKMEEEPEEVVGLRSKFGIQKELVVHLTKIDNSVPNVESNANIKDSEMEITGEDELMQQSKAEERPKRKPKPKVPFDEQEASIKRDIKTAIKLSLKNKIEGKLENNNNQIKELQKSETLASQKSSENESAGVATTSTAEVEETQGTKEMQEIKSSAEASTSKLTVETKYLENSKLDDNEKPVSESQLVVTPRRQIIDRTEVDENQKTKLLMLMNATKPQNQRTSSTSELPLQQLSASPRMPLQISPPVPPLAPIQSPSIHLPPAQQFCILFIPDGLYNPENGGINKDITPTATIVNFQPVPDNEIGNKSLIYTPATPTKISTDENAKVYVCPTCTEVLDLIGRLEASLGMTEEDKSTITCPYCSNNFQSLYYLEYHLMQEHFKCENEKQCKHSGFNSLRIPNNESTSESETYITFALKCRSCYDIFANVLTLNDHVMHKHRSLVRLKPTLPSTSTSMLSAFAPFGGKNGGRLPTTLLQCPSDCVCRIGIRSTDSPLQRQQMLKRCPNAMRRLEKIEPAAYEVYTCTLCKSTFLMKDEVVDHLMKMHEVSCKFPCLTCLTSFRTMQLQENHRCSETTLQDLDKLLSIAILPANVSSTGSGKDNNKFLEREDSSTDEYGSIKASAATESSPTKLTSPPYKNGYKRKNGEALKNDILPKKLKLVPHLPKTFFKRSYKRHKRNCPKCEKKFAYRKSFFDHIIYEHVLKGEGIVGPKKKAAELLKLLGNGQANGQNIEELAEILSDNPDEEGLSFKNLLMYEEDERENWEGVAAPTPVAKEGHCEKDIVQCRNCKGRFKLPGNLGNFIRHNNHKRSGDESDKVDEQHLCFNCDSSGPKTRRRSVINNGHHFKTTGDSCDPAQSQKLKIIHPFVCKKCPETFPTAIELKLHKRNVHNKLGEPLQVCEICKKTFASVRMLAKHKRLHHESVLDDSAKTEEDESNRSANQSGAGDGESCSKDNSEVNDSLNDKTNNSSRRDSSDSSSGGSKEPEEQPLNCSFCEEVCSSKVSLKNHLKREHGRRASICQFCNGLLIDTSEVRHMLDYHIVPCKTISKNNGCIVQCEASCMQEDVEELIRTLGKERLQSLMMYHDFEGKCNNAIMRCPMCPEVFATRESCRYHYVWIHDDNCLLCDETFRSGSSAFQHKVAAHTSTASYLWCIQRLVTAIVNTMRLDPDQPSHVLFQMMIMRLEEEEQAGAIESNTEATRSNTEAASTEEASAASTERFLEEVVLSEDQLPDSGNMIEVVIGKEDSEDDLLSMLNLSPNYENHEQHKVPNAGAAPPEEEFEEETINPPSLPTSPLVNVPMTTVVTPSTPTISNEIVPTITSTTVAAATTATVAAPMLDNYVTSGVCKYRLENDEEQLVLVVTDEDLITFRDDIGSLAERISATCDSLTLDEITEMLRAYFDSMNAGA